MTSAQNDAGCHKPFGSRHGWPIFLMDRKVWGGLCSGAKSGQNKPEQANFWERTADGAGRRAPHLFQSNAAHRSQLRQITVDCDIFGL
jgi:hypothetical protein